MTDTEKQEIISEVLAQLRADSKDFSGSQIAIKSAFEDAYEERSKIKLPAFDERTNSGADATAGTISLEALLTAYGLTRVEEIAEQASTSYMKKVADSDLNMKGYNVTGINRLYSVGNSGRMVIVPNLTSADFGLTASASMEELFIEYLKWVYAHHTGIGQISFIGTFAKSGQTYGEIKGTMLTGANYVDSNGIPTEYTFIATYMKRNVYFGVRDGANEQPVLYNISTFPFSDTTKDNRINMSGASEDGSSYYIRYENGFQICFGSFTKNVSVSSANGSVYTRSLYVDHLYPVPFTSVVHLSVTPSYNYIDGVYHNLWVGYNYTYTSKIQYIGISSPTPINNTDLKFDFIAIGKWK